MLGIPATFLKEGLRGVVADPFAAVACLALIGLVFARPLFRIDAITWIALEAMLPNGVVPPPLAGFVAAIVGMAAGSALPAATRNTRA